MVEKHQGSIAPEEAQPLTQPDAQRDSNAYSDGRLSVDSSSTASASLLMMDKLNDSTGKRTGAYRDSIDEFELEEDPHKAMQVKGASKKTKLVFWVLLILCLGGWIVAFFVMLFKGGAKPGKESAEARPAIPSITGFSETDKINDQAPPTNSGKKKITFEQAWGRQFQPASHSISWIPGPNGEDGLMLVEDKDSKGEFLRVEDVTAKKNGQARATAEKRILMKHPFFSYNGKPVKPGKTWPSPDLKKVLILSAYQKSWRHSYTGIYWIFDVEKQEAEPLDPQDANSRIQLATWSPNSDAIVFTRDNNMFIRKLGDEKVTQFTKDGGKNLFYGVPDWVYEEEVYSGNSVTWWSNDGKHIAFLRTNETTVPDYPVQYFLSSHSGKKPKPGQENYPDTLAIKYPKAGAPNPIVDIQFYDVGKNEVFSVDIKDEFEDDDRLIIEVVWASEGHVLVRETNRESDLLKILLIDAESRTGAVVRSEDVQALDGGWVEPTQYTRYLPANPKNGLKYDGYIDTVIYDGRDHLALFSPINSSEPVMLTKGEWEVVTAPSAVDPTNGLVYFIAASDEPWKRHVYSVKLDGNDMKQLTNSTEDGYYDVSFSHNAAYALLHYQGPSIPWQKVISTPSNKQAFEDVIEENKDLAKKIEDYALPDITYHRVEVEGYQLPVKEYRPKDFDPKKKYPVLFNPYAGPNSQSVDQKFSVNFHSYVAATLGYIVVTVDGRGTGFIGRKARCIIRGQLGKYETHDQIAVAKMYAAKPYIDEKRVAIWGWSYGGYMTLKTLEQDAGETFSYGMAVAPVTDFSFYDSVYTERYMRTPQHNPEGYKNTAITNATALSKSVRFLVMHGTGDDNVHVQNTLTLLDKLDLAGVDNYDVHVFPDSDHSIYFHNANRMVYGRLNDWLINAFNGEWLNTTHPQPKPSKLRRALNRIARRQG